MSIAHKNEQPTSFFKRMASLVTAQTRDASSPSSPAPSTALDEFTRYRGPTVSEFDLLQACIRRGCALHACRQYEEALAEFERAIAMRPDLPQPYNNLGSTLYALGRYDLALDALDRALAINDTFADAYRNKAAVLVTAGRFDESFQYLERAVELAPNDPLGLVNRAGALILMCRPQEALEFLDRAVNASPESIDAHWNKAVSKLMLGDLLGGFELYEWRLKKWDVLPEDEYQKPVWLGVEPVFGKTILVTPEQGLGDILQFCRYVPMIESLGGRVVIESRKPLLAVLRTISPLATVVEQGQPLPEYDFVCPIVSLPLAFKTTLESIPASIPYLYADATKSKQWKERLGPRKGLRVGLVWSGGFRPNQPEIWSTNERRNIPLHKLAPLNLPGVEFFSLQIGDDGMRQLRDLRQAGWQGPAIADLTDAIADFSDTAALIDNLDLVISVDTSTAHLAGAMGKPVWILNRFDTCWRWMLERTDTPWYPTMRLFRQPILGDWESVINEVRNALQLQIADSGRSDIAATDSHDH
jgi:tetratricopeptide (TPR) repeat protein